MKIAIITKFNKEPIELKKLLNKFNFTYVTEDPDLVISEGGDGTLLISERTFPGVPKLLLKKSRICKNCTIDLPVDEILKLLKEKKYKITEHTKLQLKTSTGERLTCTNDFIIRNKIPTQAIRFTVSINKEKINDIFIGDGLVISTPFGSTAYFNSITGKSFKTGFGIAFNNIQTSDKDIMLQDTDKVKVKIIRGQAELGTDNNPRTIILNSGDYVYLSKSNHNLKVVTL